ncbi:phytanoyl-CoA dioxygenase family protein [Xanthomonas campestris pv. campestris]|uniref:phytanoyl-CoA dioxygenase family protein n=1 Tax=Xanthomonas campestris TaxID=339 RepID=UPI001E4CD1CB|nr:phytanoyl-CoA dioxygenase family protein [Xanthomonas campestris]MCD0254769.1 phytanoyl-CoA dioxygenase family protein [Xanthomonas campestris pv. campestris]MEB1300193.1 phytanoyl-CoA dioxygenase family protein [Xanthomonas campestris pv. campestris]MEB1308987.1 phytanoyl-CoA dioxygenase family protein [Xanthomonas campestris pv. campestris]MEB1334082.1 phytanoyl-CoA dioxygenase family protein [Xanthomonas campestris pv. campestris]MEB1899970.1 phytanoyl-CoA dioxygenase family protein [Xan
MQLTEEQLTQYRNSGFVFLPGHFSQDEVQAMRDTLPTLFAEASPRRVLEKDGVTVRSLHGSHRHVPLFESLVRDPRLLGAAEGILGDSLYVHQFKINSKRAFGGDEWAWHQDFIFWEREDGIRNPDLVTAALFLDEVNEFNGPLVLIEGSHKEGVIDVAPSTGKPSQYDEMPEWISNLTADIKYSVPQQKVESLSRAGQLVAPKGPSGSVLLFHPNLVHGSASNISPFDRSVVLVTYNRSVNAPVPGAGKQRPDFLCERDCTPIGAAVAQAG